MRPEALAALHAAAFAPARSWSAAEFDSFLADPACLLVARPEGFALARVTLDEAELLTIATDPARRRQGVARGLLGALFGGLAGRGAETLFLEVAEDNAAARALYAGASFAMAGRRRGYYPRRNGAAADALILRRALG
ncbi:GNAT family N-acetyltransferase [Marinovum algicola]|uniref:GNAT family N-acetyltransferase n=1 Tax=Marinovum algicola TaxID=42444 RepID=UPI0024B915FD|nr:GNAT family N-acetyltransferase [Marinovum algicola]